MTVGDTITIKTYPQTANGTSLRKRAARSIVIRSKDGTIARDDKSSS